MVLESSKRLEVLLGERELHAGVGRREALVLEVAAERRGSAEVRLRRYDESRLEARLATTKYARRL